MSIKPRSPRYFPLMKVRGARRRRVAGLQRMAGRFDSLSASAEATREALNILFETWRTNDKRN